MRALPRHHGSCDHGAASHVHSNITPLSNIDGCKSAKTYKRVASTNRCVATSGLFDSLFSSVESITIKEDEEAMAVLREIRAARGRGVNNELVVASLIPGEGRGLMAKHAIRKGQNIVSVPWDVVITPSVAAELSILAKHLKQSPPLPDWSLLALWLVQLRHADSLHASQLYKNHNNGDDLEKYTHLYSIHQAYAAVLPNGKKDNETDTMGRTVLEWSQHEVDLLQGSYLHSRALEIRRAAQESWKEIEPIIKRAEAEGIIPTGSVFTERSLRHAFSILLSRLIRVRSPSFDTNSYDEWVEVLCPWADFVNHSCTCTNFLSYDHNTNGIILTADVDYKAGEQVYASYGPKTSGELLLSYGFYPSALHNPHDACLLAVPSSLGSSDSAGVPTERVFPLRMGAVPQELMDYYITNNSVRGIVDLCKQALAKYHIKLEEAKIELDKEVKHTGGEIRSVRAAILDILMKEQKILTRTSFLLKQRLK